MPAISPFAATSAAFAQGFLMMGGLIVAIGAQNALVLRQGLARAHVGPVVVFCTVSDVVLIAAGVFGLGAWVHEAPALLQGLRFGGAAFLGWCAWRAARRAFAGGAALPSARGATALGPTLALTAALTWLNPHVYLDTVVLLGVIGAQQPAPLRPPFAAGAALASTLWFASLGFGAAVLAPRLSRPATWRCIDAAIALVMAVIALQLLATPLG